MAEQPENVIRFHIEPENQGDPPPFRAVQSIPDWLKQMPAEIEVGGVGKISMLKLCAPFVEAMSCGYIIPLRGPVRFTLDQSQKLEIANLDFAATGGVATEQPAAQYRGTPFGGMFVVKFVNHWHIITPPGYSCLFLPILNQFIMPFQIFAGVIETDTYYRGVHFPAICHLQPGSQVTLPRGTPLVQVIPFRREVWNSEHGLWDIQRAIAAADQATANPHHYKDNNWVKKEFR